MNLRGGDDRRAEMSTEVARRRGANRSPRDVRLRAQSSRHRRPRRYADIRKVRTEVDCKLVVVRRFPAMILAELAKSALGAYDIEAVIHHAGSHQQRLRPELGTEIGLMVRAADVEAALEILGPPGEERSPE